MKFLEHFNHPKNFRFKSFEFTLLEALKRNHKVLVETGVARGKQKFLFFSKINWKDGMSTLIFSEFAKHVNGSLSSCDIDKKNVENAKKFTKKNKEFINFFVKDSIKFLFEFDKKIDLLYLDSLDGQLAGAAEHQLKEIKAAEKNLHERSLVLLDDKGAKTNLSIDYMLKNNFKIINETDQQVLLSY